MQGYWYCTQCDEEVDGSRVTFEETHDFCGAKVEWIEEDLPTAEDLGEEELERHWRENGYE